MKKNHTGKSSKARNMWKALKMELEEHRSSAIVYFTLRFLVILVMILQILNRNYENVFLCILTLLLLIIPSFIQVNLRIELPTTLEIIMLLFIFAAEILGEIRAYYVIYPFWDTMLHTLNGFLAAAIGFSLVNILNREERFEFKLSPLFMAVVAFCFSMTIGILWEFIEFGVDNFFGLDMQKDTILHSISSVMLDPTGGNTPTKIKNITSVALNGVELGLGGYLDVGLRDTMKDLLVNFIGATVFSVIGFFYVKKKGHGAFASRFIPHLKQKSADFLSIITEQEQEKEKKSMKKQIKIQTIIFDIGNVLVDFNFSEIFHRYAADEAIYQKIVEATVHSSAWNEFDKGVWSDEKILGAFIQNDPSVEQELRDIFTHLEGMIQQRTETIPWIHALKAQGYQVLYLSNFPQRTYLMNYEAMNFIQEMDGGILSYQEKEIKPEEPIYRLLIEKYNLIPEACVFLDDVENNLVTARKLGMQTILFTNKEEAVAELSKVGVYCKE